MNIATTPFWSSLSLRVGLYNKTGYYYVKSESESALNKPYLIWVQWPGCMHQSLSAVGQTAKLYQTDPSWFAR